MQCQQLSATHEKIKHLILLEVVKVIGGNLNPKKALGYDELSPKNLKSFQRIPPFILRIYTMLFYA